jgi:hypothetical protein
MMVSKHLQVLELSCRNTPFFLEEEIGASLTTPFPKFPGEVGVGAGFGMAGEDREDLLASSLLAYNMQKQEMNLY